MRAPGRTREPPPAAGLLSPRHAVALLECTRSSSLLPARCGFLTRPRRKDEPCRHGRENPKIKEIREAVVKSGGTVEIKSSRGKHYYLLQVGGRSMRLPADLGAAGGRITGLPSEIFRKLGVVVNSNYTRPADQRETRAPAAAPTEKRYPGPTPRRSAHGRKGTGLATRARG